MMTIEEVRKILGKEAMEMTNQEISLMLIRLSELASWVLDDFEEKTFGNVLPKKKVLLDK